LTFPASSIRKIAESFAQPASAAERSRRLSRAIVLLSEQYWAAAGLILILAAINLTFRLTHEIVVEWDESLYGISAWEMLRNHHWVGTTFMGTLDYYNTKPPLNIWLITLAFKAFGPNLISLRLPSIASAFITVVVLQAWVRRAVSPAVALLASLILASSFGFLYDHSARNANTDALFSCLVLLTAVTLWAADARPIRLVWLAPILAAVFLLRGMGVLMPVALIGVVEARRLSPWHGRARALLVALVLAMLPIGAWTWTRWRLDQWRFLKPLFLYDFIARSVSVIEGHRGTPLYHLNVLQKNEIEWVLSACAACVLFPVPWRSIRKWLRWRTDDRFRLVMGSWATITLLMPALVRTKLSWYLNPFYPAFAVIVAMLLVRAFAAQTRESGRKFVVVMIIGAALTMAETRLGAYSVYRRNLTRSAQGFLLEHRKELSGHRVFRRGWSNSEVFVLDVLIGAEAREADGPDAFVRTAQDGDYWFSGAPVDDPQLAVVTQDKRRRLYRYAQ
jgi:4-amino-4-deoxy-L-arabinose transferase-like glycosyltransferase